MKYLRHVGPRRTELAELPTPEPGPGQVLVEVRACGICAGDLDPWRLAAPDGNLRLGHEPAGVVRSVGIGVTRWQPGDRVTGRFGPAFAEYAAAAETDLVRMPDSEPFDTVLGEPLGCLCEAERRTGMRLGDRAAVVGLGFMGLGLMQLLRIRGASHILGVDPRSDARARACRSGADEVLSPDAVPAAYRSTSLGTWARMDGFDIVVEASGTQGGLALAGELVKPHGTLSILGFHEGAPRLVDVGMWNWKAMNVVNAHVRLAGLQAEATRAGMAMVAAGRLSLGDLVTHRFALADFDDAMRLLEARPDGFVKAVVVLDDRERESAR